VAFERGRRVPPRVSVAASQPGSQVVTASVYGVRYEEFDGPHEVPTEVAREALS
jgi:hypothetical protein